MTGKLSCNIKSFILSLLILTGLPGPVAAQRVISGTINQYGRVTAIGVSNVIIPDAVQITYFHANDTVLLIQMKGIRTYVTDGSYGVHEGTYGSPGQHEFLMIQSVDNGTGNVTFNRPISNSFNTDGQVQLIRVPSFSSVVVNGVLSCAAWDSASKTGGVLAAIIRRTISLNADINVTGKGFNGGSAASSLPGGVCIETSPKMYRYAYPVSADSAGNKGEGPVSRALFALSDYPGIYPKYGKGKGANLSAGGGGDGRFSGGGGGGNYGAGGTGGKELGCGLNYNGGLGGLPIKPTIFGTDGMLFMGGGGGSSVYLPGATPTSGSNGGGIVILVCENLKANGHGIYAEGATPAGIASGNTGAGGGGGGGSIALYLQSYVNSIINISANGGEGGNNQGAFGAGGGGGGGFINTSNISIPSGSSKTIAGGVFGTGLPTSNSAPGSAGDVKTTFVPILNGFLFNSIRSSVTGGLIDSICSDTYMSEISGTNPVGGTPGYTYFWEYSVTSDNSGFSPAPGTNNQINYTPPSYLTQTTWFRRTVTDNSTIPIIDISKPVKIIVLQAITDNLVGNDETICSSWNPNRINPLNSGPSNGDGNYSYQWLSNIDNATWTTNAPGTSTLSYYDPAALSTTTYYKRKVTSGKCVDNSATVIITVYPSITGNVTTRPDSVICQGSSFNVLGASAAEGYGSFIYLWQDSTTTSAAWLPATGTNSNTTYSADTSEFATIEDRYYRRVVSSDPVNICLSKSVPIHLTSYHKIKNNVIAADQTICSGITPAPLSGSLPIQGNLSYSYQWQESSKLSPWITKWTSQTGYPPAPPSDSTWYRRIVNSSKCTSTSNNIIIIVYHTPVAYAGPDHKICGRVVTLAAVKSYGTGLWTFPSRAHSADPTIPKAVISLDSFNTAMDTVTFFWRETNWTCTSMDAVKITFDNHPDNVNAGTGGDIMTFDNSTLVHASPILSFESGTWSVVSGDGDPVDEHSDSTYMRNIAIGENIYKWTVTNDTCSLSDTVRFIVSHPVIPEGISPNGDLINDTLNISGIDFNVQEADLKILNSAGTLVFSTSNRKKQDKWVYWDGKDSKGAMLPEGTYYYLLNVYTPDTGHVSKVSGFIILKRR
jgi:gliding motility-associated-like protein